MPLMHRLFLNLLLLIGLAVAPQAQESFLGQTAVGVTDAVSSRVVASHLAVTPGQTIRLAWDIRLEPHWHVYWQNPGDSGLAPRLIPANPAVSVENVQWPLPKVISLPPITNYGYEDRVVLVMDVRLPDMIPAGPLELPLQLEYLYCKDMCLPGKVSLVLPLEVAAASRANPAFDEPQAYASSRLPLPLPVGAEVRAFREGAETFLVMGGGMAAQELRFIPFSEGWLDDAAAQQRRERDGYVQLALPHDPHGTSLPERVQGILLAGGQGYHVDVALGDAPVAQKVSAGLGTALLLAFLAGLVLNLMPCVLPVVALKVFSLVRTRNARERMAHTAVYAAGVLTTFWAMGGLIAVLQQGGTKLGWGFQMQNPYFVAVLAALMLAMAMNFWGVFKTGAWLTRWGMTSRGDHESYGEAFLTGLVTVLVATPCTVPFMGTAMAYALAQPLAGILYVFTALGLGMVAPLALVALVPQLAALLPRPGAWMESFKQLLGWPLLVTALWLVWVFAGQTGTMALFVLLSLLVVLAFALWLYGLYGNRRSFVLVLAVVAVAAWMLPTYTVRSDAVSPWREWSADAVHEARSGGSPVLVDFTADWCITCKFTEATVLETSAVQNLFARHGVVLFKADWTSYNPAITAELARHGRRGVPLYLLYLSGRDEPLVLPQLLTFGVLEQVLKGASHD